MPIRFKRTECILSGLTKEQVIEKTKASLANKEFPALEPGAMSYMMSRQSFLSDSAGRWIPYLMFDVPVIQSASWGSDMPDCPVYFNALDQNCVKILIHFGYRG